MTYEFEGKTEKDAIEKATIELGLESDQFDVEIIETQKKTLFKSGYVKIRVHTDEATPGVKYDDDNESPVETAKRVMGNPIPQDEANVEIMFREEKKIGLKLSSENSSILIGRKGKNLDALQLLANVYAGHLGREDVRIILDTENYRVRREENLVHLAYTTADKVRTKRTSILLEPMNPFERRLIHTTLNDFSDIETKSEGEGLYKQVRVIFKGNY